jgi:hypothetical protein
MNVKVYWKIDLKEEYGLGPIADPFDSNIFYVGTWYGLIRYNSLREFHLKTDMKY